MDRILPEERHGETAAERNDRNLGDLLQELRVAGLGVQVLFGFLLSLPFTVRFVKLDGTQRDLYEAALLLAALSIALLIAPVAYHRWVFRRHEKERLLRTANVLALAGLATVALAVCMSVLLVLTFVASGWAVSVMVALTFSTFVLLWLVLPLWGAEIRRSDRRHEAACVSIVRRSGDQPRRSDPSGHPGRRLRLPLRSCSPVGSSLAWYRCDWITSCPGEIRLSGDTTRDQGHSRWPRIEGHQSRQGSLS